jgi:DNA helicase-2/ATP-dependent DNA helicase PcrA
MDITHILNELNDKQREAVTADLNSSLQVLAGAGSGKTRVLVYRIAWLIEVENLSPFNLLAVTFTNKAAKEMRGRIEEMVGLKANNMWIGTFHSLAHRLLRAHWKEADLSQNFQVIDSDDQYRLVKRIMKDLNLDEARWPPKQAQWYISNKKDEGLRSQHIAENSYSDFDQIMLRVYQRYEEICQQGGLVDFSELLLRSFELLRDNLEILTHYQNRFKQILVDEFQDTNSLQYAWVKLLAGKNNRVMAVGDDDQSIYSWRGAKVGNMLTFAKDFGDAKTIKLEQNYRSTGHILNAANKLISSNTSRLGKNLWTSSSEGELISVYAAFNDMDEARFIVDQIKQWSREEGSLNECAVLYRSNAQSRTLEDAFIQAGVAYRIYGGLRFFERAEIKDALAYLRIIDREDDDPAFERIVNTPTRGIGLRTIAFLREQAHQHKQSMWYSAKQAIEQKLLPSRALTALGGFIDLIENLRRDIQGVELDEQIEHVIHHSGLYEHFKKDRSEKGRARIENLEELVTAANQFDPEETDEQPMPKMASFLTHAALEAGDTQAAKHEDCVQLMTLHSAKGLEFPLVFLAGMEEGLFPHQMSLDERDGLEEERRLAYVGMTRAMKKLYLCYAESRYLYGKEKIQTPSRFISELPSEHLAEVRMRTTISRPFNRKTGGKAKPSKFADEHAKYKVGQMVKHGKFGDGIILNVEGSGAKARVQINFNSCGSKWLIAEMANLETA